MRIAIFGTGTFFSDHYSMIKENDDVVAVLDNSRDKWGVLANGHIVKSPSALSSVDYEIVLLMVNKTNAASIRKQLLGKGLNDDEIWFWSEYFLDEKISISTLDNNVLIISPDLDYVGGVIAEMYAAQVLMEEGKGVTIVASGGNKHFIDEYRKKGFCIGIVPYIEYIDADEIDWIMDYEYVLVNVFQLFRCVKTIGDKRRILWWIHEPSEFYKRISDYEMDIVRSIDFNAVRVMAVSDIAKESFLRYTCIKCNVEILHYGIPKFNSIIRTNTDVVNCAIIGTVCPNKGQDILLDAIEKLSMDERNHFHFWIVGNIGDEEYGSVICRRARELRNITITGQLGRKEVEDLESRMDVIVSSSREDCLPIVITEGLMLGKTCIMSTNTGFRTYIKNMENGLVFESGNSVELTKTIRWILNHKERLQVIGENGRTLYEDMFSMNSFKKRLVLALTN